MIEVQQTFLLIPEFNASVFPASLHRLGRNSDGMPAPGKEILEEFAMKRKKRTAVLVLLCTLTALLTAGIWTYCQDMPRPADELPVTQTSVPEDWRLILVNASHAIPDSYKVELTELANGRCVDTRIYPDLQAMFDAARSEGVYPVVGEGYRTHEEQERMMQEKIDGYLADGCSSRQARALAEEWVAVPGTSEHELGLAVDINADTAHSENWEVYTWLADNAYRYGFILRYPEGKEEITGIAYEAWHYRYVGEEAALAIHSQGITLEEYLEG